MKSSIVGSKGGAGVAERIVSELPAHEIYIEAFAGGAAVGRLKKPSTLAIFIDKDLRTASSLRARVSAAAHVICGDARSLLVPDRVPADAVLYLDPPYLASVRRQPRRRYYRCEQLEEHEHASMLDWASSFRCRVLISGYMSSLYAARLSRGWRLIQFGAQTRGGPSTECLWCNFAPPAVLHDTRFVGAGFRERERIKRKVGRWVRGLARLPLAERACILAAFDEAGLPRARAPSLDLPMRARLADSGEPAAPSFLTMEDPV